MRYLIGFNYKLLALAVIFVFNVGIFAVPSAQAGEPSPGTLYSDRDTFYSAFPVVSIESFELGNSSGGIFAGPLDASTTNSFILSGPIQEGVRFDVQSGNLDFYNDYSSDTYGNSTVLRGDTSGAVMDITFPQTNVTAIGFTLYAEFPGTYINVFHVIGGVTQVNQYVSTGPEGKFYGVSFTGLVDNIQIIPGAAKVYIDDVVFNPVSRIKWYPTRVKFNAANKKSLLTEDFEDSTSGSDSGSTIDYTTDNVMFDPCDIARGVKFGANGLSMNAGGFAVNDGYFTNSQILRRTSDNDIMGIQFTPTNTTVVAFDTFVEPSQVNAISTVYDEYTNAVFACSTVATSSMGGFFGASITNGSISFVTIYPHGSFASVDNLTFAGNHDCDGDGIPDDYVKPDIGGIIAAFLILLMD